MTDTERLLRKLAFIETRVSELQRLSEPERLRSDIKEERFVTHTLQIAIQAAMDAAAHIVAARRLGEPKTNRDLFALLAADGWIDEQIMRTMHLVSGFRNVVVHGYDNVEIDIVEDILANRCVDLLEFCSQLRSRLDRDRSR